MDHSTCIGQFLISRVYAEGALEELGQLKQAYKVAYKMPVYT